MLMVDKIFCPICNKTNDLNKFCIYCGHKLLGDNQTRLIHDSPEPLCLNCGRPFSEDQVKCECGFEFADIICPECGTKNSYKNRFCTRCGERLWTFRVYDYKYTESLFEDPFSRKRLPYALRNTSLNTRVRKGIGKCPEFWIWRTQASTVDDLKSEIRKVDGYLREICSRWKVISPDYCINCLYVIKSDEYSCAKCGLGFMADKKRVESLQSKNSYIEPEFEDEDAKWTPKYSGKYMQSLAPAPGESQFEYRERLKWEYVENGQVKKSIKEIINNLNEEKTSKAPPKQVIGDDGWYCSYNCKYYLEYYEGDQMDADHDFSYCALGNTEIYNRNFCKDYEE